MEAWLQPALRFLHYALLLGLFGSAGFRTVGLNGANWVPPRSGRATTIVAAMLAPFVSIGLMLASIAAMMGQSVTTLEWSMIKAMIFDTSMGWAFLARTGLLVAGLVALIIGRKAGSSIAALCFAVALLTLGWSGHAAATEGALGLVHRLGNGVHLLAAGLWLGAIGWFVHLSAIAHDEARQVSTRPLLTVMHRFASLGIVLVAIVSLTGLLNAQLIFGLENSAVTLTTTYGWLLTAKVAIVGGMLVFGAHNAWISRRRVGNNVRAEQTQSAALASLRRSLTIELTLGIVVIGLVAILGMLSPIMME